MSTFSAYKITRGWRGFAKKVENLITFRIFASMRGKWIQRAGLTTEIIMRENDKNNGRPLSAKESFHTTSKG